MDTKEKLVEIVKKAAYSSLPSNTENFHLNMFVTNLLAHGVTVQEWISVDDRLPEESGLYITFGCTAVPVLWLHNFDKDMGKFGVWWDYDTDGKKHPRYRFIEAEDITHWMLLPSTEGLK